jgi:hypothetical protein
MRPLVKQKEIKDKKTMTKRKRSSKISWKDVGSEFKLAFFNLASLMEETFKKARKEMTKKKKKR